MADSPQQPTNEHQERTAEFLRLLTTCDQQLYAYVLALVVSLEDADEIVQITKVKLWEQFDRFEPGTNFAGWARTVAYYEVLSFRQRCKGRHEHVLGRQFIESVTEQAAQMPNRPSDRRAALDKCLAKLDEACRAFVLRCYTSGVKINRVAAEMGRPVTAVYQRLWRLRKQLHHCVERELEGLHE